MVVLEEPTAGSREGLRRRRLAVLPASRRSPGLRLTPAQPQPCEQAPEGAVRR